MLRILLLVIVAALAIILIWLNILSWRNGRPPSEISTPEQLAWQEALDWQAGEEAYPGGWGWGNLQFETDYLQLSPRRQPTGAYVFPGDHAADFVLVAEFMVPSGNDGTTRLHLMTRDRGAANNVSGCVLTVASDTMHVQHTINATEHILARVPTAAVLDTDRWHRLRFTSARGAISVLLDGDEIFAAAGPYPPGMYAESYVAAEGGAVRLREFKILAAPWGGK